MFEATIRVKWKNVRKENNVVLEDSFVTQEIPSKEPLMAMVFISMYMTEPRFYIGCSRTSVCKVLMNFLSSGFIMSWVTAQESSFNKLHFLMFIKISDGIKFLNQINICQEIYFFSVKNSKVGQIICCNLQE